MRGAPLLVMMGIDALRKVYFVHPTLTATTLNTSTESNPITAQASALAVFQSIAASLMLLMMKNAPHRRAVLASPPP